MKEIKKIYLDLDGVLADFDGGLRKLCGVEPVDQMHATKEDEDRTFGAIRDCEHFYRRMEMLPGAKELFDRLYAAYGDRLEILSGVPSPKRNIPEAGEDKLAWVKEHLSETVKVNLVRRAEKKEYCTGKDCVLIDDFEKNIQEWEAAGGTGILFQDMEEVFRKLH